MKKLIIFCLLTLLAIGLASVASAGEYWMIVATDGEGIAVYGSSGGGRQVGTLYNGYQNDLSLEPTNGRYSCWLTKDTVVWLNNEKAMKRLPHNVYGASSEGADQVPCSCFLAEVTEDGAGLYTGTGHKHLLAKHKAGTLLLVCGSFGKDYFVKGGGAGFMAKSALQKVKDLTFVEAWDACYGMTDLPTATVYVEGGRLKLASSATGYSEVDDGMDIKHGGQVVILRDLGDWAQVAKVYEGRIGSGGFIEKRYLDPEGDHSVPTAVVKTSHPLNRLNVRYTADKDAWSEIKLCAGVRVQVVSRGKDWTEIAIYATKGNRSVSGFVMTEYLAFGADADKVEDACVRVRLTRQWPEYPRYYYYQYEPYPAGTEATVFAVASGDRNIFTLQMDDGAFIDVTDDATEPLLEPVNPTAWNAKTSKSLTLRSGPNSDSKKLGTVKSGAKVEVLLRGEKWALVRYKDKTGYVLSSGLKPIN